MADRAAEKRRRKKAKRKLAPKDRRRRFEVAHFEDGHVKAYTAPMHPEVRTAFEAQEKAFRKKFGRDMGPTDPIFFDPDADEPRPLPEKTADAYWDSMIAAAEGAGVPPAQIHAIRKTERFVTSENVELIPDDALEEWEDAVDEGE
jgi:hypothetical protein